MSNFCWKMYSADIPYWKIFFIPSLIHRHKGKFVKKDPKHADDTDTGNDSVNSLKTTDLPLVALTEVKLRYFTSWNVLDLLGF